MPGFFQLSYGGFGTEQNCAFYVLFVCGYKGFGEGKVGMSG